MKCDKLKPLVFSINDLAYIDESAVVKNFDNPHDHAVYKATEVDEFIAEKDAEIEKLKAENERLKKCEIWMKQHFYCEEVIACESAKTRKLKRELWLARAYRAEARKEYWYARSCHEGDKDLWSIDGSHVKYIGCIKRTNFDWLKIWSEVERKCRAKAEEFK